MERKGTEKRKARYDKSEQSNEKRARHTQSQKTVRTTME